jgi:hypothetical protein
MGMENGVAVAVVTVPASASSPVSSAMRPASLTLLSACLPPTWLRPDPTCTRPVSGLLLACPGLSRPASTRIY